MAKINNLRLQIDPTDREKFFKVTVSFRLTFKQAEAGKKFQYAISLRPSEINLGDGDIETPSPSVLYWFKFGNSTRKTVTGGPFSAVTSVTRMVSAGTLNEDEFSHPTGPNGETAPNNDNIFASMVLMTGGKPFVQTLDEKRTEVVTLTIK